MYVHWINKEKEKKNVWLHFLFLEKRWKIWMKEIRRSLWEYIIHNTKISNKRTLKAKAFTDKLSSIENPIETCDISCEWSFHSGISELTLSCFFFFFDSRFDDRRSLKLPPIGFEIFKTIISLRKKIFLNLL